MAASERVTVALRTQEDVVRLRHRVREQAVGLKFSLLEQTKIVTAASELGRNVLTYGGAGEAIIEACMKNGPCGLASARVGALAWASAVRDAWSMSSNSVRKLA